MRIHLETEQSRFILHTHLIATATKLCTSCGQTIPPPLSYSSRNSISKRIGIAISILLHALALLYYVTHDTAVKRVAPPVQEGTMVYIAPIKDQPKAQPSMQQVARLKLPPVRQKQAIASTASPRARLKKEVLVPPVVAPMATIAPPASAPQPDMESMVAARRQLRAAAQSPAAEPQESAEERGQRIARANIAGAQGSASGSGNDKNGAGGVFSIANQNYHSADVKFRGWNGNFKRNWTQQVRVDQGGEPDIETAIVKQMIALIRKEKTGDFVWDSQRLGRHVNLSARVADTTELQAFLLKEFFPDYRGR